MIYLLIVPICLYSALALAFMQRRPYRLSNPVLALYAWGSVAALTSYLILGSTRDVHLAEAAAVAVILVTGVLNLVGWPAAVLSIFMGDWLARQVRRRALPVVALLIPGVLATLALIATSDPALVVPRGAGYIIQWFSSPTGGMPWPLVIVTMVGVHVPLAAAFGFMLHRGRVGLWGVVLPGLVMFSTSIVVPVVAPLAGATWGALLAGLGHGAPLLLLVALVWIETRRSGVAAAIEAYLDDPVEAALMIDAGQRVVWYNRAVARWLDRSPPTVLDQPLPLSDFLPDSDLLLCVKTVLQSDDHAAGAEFEIMAGGRARVLRPRVEALAGLHAVPGARLLVLHDATESAIRRNLEDRSQELLALSAISADISSTLDRHEVIRRALHQLSTVIAFDGAAVYLRDQTNPDRMNLARQIRLHENMQDIPPQLPTNAGTSGETLRKRRAVFVADASQFPAYREGFARLKIRAGASVPLIARDEAVGVLYVAYEHPHTFSPLEIALLEGVARQIAVAVDNARLHEQERQQRLVAEMLHQAAHAVTHHSPDEALTLLLDQLAELVEFERATLLLRADGETLRIRAHKGILDSPDPDDIRAIRVSISDFTYLGRLFETQTAQLVPDTAQDAAWKPGKYGQGSWMGVPVIIRGAVVGCFSLSHSQPGHFTHDHQVWAQTYAAQAAVAIENAQFIEKEQQRRREAELLHQAGYELVTEQDANRALAAALDKMARLLAFDRAHVLLLGADGTGWGMPVGYPTGVTLDMVLDPTLEGYPLLQSVIDRKAAVLVPDTRDESRWVLKTGLDHLIRCWLGVPLVVRDQVVGVLDIISERPHAFSADDVQTAQLFAHQMAGAVESFRLLEAASRQNRTLRALYDVVAVSNEALIQDDLPAVLLERVLETLELSGGVLHLATADNRLRLMAASGLDDATRAQVADIPVAACLPDLTVADGTRLTFTSVPLRAHGVATGLLSVLTPPDTEPALGADLEPVLAQLGQQLGVILDNARLFDDVARRSTLSTDLGRLSLAISAQLDRRAVLDLICEETLGVFDVDGAYIWLTEGNDLVGHAAVGPGADRFIGARLPLHQHTLLPARVLDEWSPQYTNYIQHTGSLTPDLLALTGAQAAIAVPLLQAEVPIGVLMLVNTREPAAFADWLLQQIGLLGVQAGLALQNANLFQEVRRRLDQLRLVNEVGRYATAILSVQSLVEGVASRLFNSFNYNMIALLQVEETGLTTNSIFVHNPPLPFIRLEPPYSPPDEVTLRAIQQAEPVLENEQCMIEASTLNGDLDLVACCLLAVPLIIADEVIGVLTVRRDGFDSITKDDLDVLEPLCAQLAISVSSARLYENLRQQAMELEIRVQQRTAELSTQKEEIQRQKERTDAILGSVADAVIVSDLQGQVVMTNRVAKELFDEHDLDLDLTRRLHDLVDRCIARADTDELTEEIEVGPVALQAKAAQVVSGNDVIGAVVVMRDISVFRELDRMKDMFVSNVSHELRTPLSNLKLYLSLLQQGRPERQASYIEVMDREAVRLERIILDLLTLSRLRSESHAERTQVRSVVDYAHIIDSVITANQARAAQEDKQLTCDHRDEPLPLGFGDPDQLERVITNLVGNALNYTPAGGHIRVRTALVALSHEDTGDGAVPTAPPGPAGHADAPPPDHIIVEVIDDGIGIPPADLAKIFDRFYRGSNLHLDMPGTGLGLAIIKEIVELHEGCIDVESEVGHGSTFRLTLPLARSEMILPEKRS